MGSVRLENFRAKFPAEIVLGYLKQQLVPTFLKPDIDFVRSFLQRTGHVTGMHRLVIEPNLHPIIAAQLKARRFLLRAVNPGPGVSHALFAPNYLEQIDDPRFLLAARALDLFRW